MERERKEIAGGAVIRLGSGIRDVRGYEHGVAGTFLGLEGGAGACFGCELGAERGCGGSMEMEKL